MPLQPGDKLGPYEILAPIGKGGMGEVYKARDTRLDRIVAIKVSDAQFSERFEREAKAIAALNHPNICQLYDVGPNYLVMEYIEGTPLKGPLPVDQALKYAAQICDALDAAHKKGITHRDLKPANILVTKAGIKLLDFGLAKLGSSGIGQAAKPPDDATLTMALTGKNEIVGTLYYMSPEQLQAQATGQEIDARSDIFSFGLVLYEMLTGKRAFEGSSPASVIAAIMERPAPSIADVAPPALDRVLKRCLEKDPEDRWQTARDLKAALEMVSSLNAEAGLNPGLQPKARSASALWPMVAAGMAVIAAGLALVHFREKPPVAEPVTFQILPPEGHILAEFLAVSPDGRKIAFVTRNQNNRTVLWVRPLDSLQAKQLTNLNEDGVGYPFWSPDSRFVGYYADSKLKKVEAAGGPPQTICDPRGIFRGAAWNQDGVIVYAMVSSDQGSGLWRVPDSGGAPVQELSLIVVEEDVGSPLFLPDGKHFLYERSSNASSGVYLGSLDHTPGNRASGHC